MPHAIQRHFDDDTELLGLDRFAMTGDRFHLEVAKLLLERKQLSLVGLATALRQRTRFKSGLDQVIIAQAPIGATDYYRAVADFYGLPFVDLIADPPGIGMFGIEVPAGFTPWRRDGHRLLIATSTIGKDDIEWADTRFGEDGYDFVIAVPASGPINTRAVG